jgi:WD40 repeat protein
VAVLKGHTNTVSALTYLPEPRLLASGSHDKTVRLWDVGTKAAVAVLEGHTGYVHALTYLPEPQLLASGSHDKTVRLWYAPPPFSAGSLHWLTSPAVSQGLKGKNGLPFIASGAWCLSVPPMGSMW